MFIYLFLVRTTWANQSAARIFCAFPEHDATRCSRDRSYIASVGGSEIRELQNWLGRLDVALSIEEIKDSNIGCGLDIVRVSSLDRKSCQLTVHWAHPVVRLLDMLVIGLEKNVLSYQQVSKNHTCVTYNHHATRAMILRFRGDTTRHAFVHYIRPGYRVNLSWTRIQSLNGHLKIKLKDQHEAKYRD